MCAASLPALRDVERLLGRSAPFRAAGRVRPQGEKWVLELEVASENGTRERQVEGESCQELAVAAATIIALTVDPNLDAPPGPVAPPESRARARPKPDRAAPPEARPAPPQPESTHQAPAQFGLVVGGYGAMDARAARQALEQALERG